MSISSSTEPLSSENNHILPDKNQLSPKLVIIRTANIVLPSQTDQTEENSKNYEKKNGTQKFKIKSENEIEVNLCPQPKIDKSLPKDNWLKSNPPLNSQNFSRDSNYFAAKLLEFETPTFQVPKPLCLQRQLRLYQKKYFGNYIPERNSFPDKIFVSKIFDLNLENIKNFYFSQSYPKILQIPKVYLKPKEKMPEPPKEKENIIQIKPKEKILPIEMIKLYFNIPDDFLIHYQIKNIEIKAVNVTQSTENFERINQISFQEMEIYINNLCQNRLKLELVKNENYVEEGYIRYDAPIKEENCCDFLHKKRKLGIDNEINYSKSKNKSGIYDASHRKHPLKKKHKKINKKLTVKLKNLIKLNNKKNGLYTCVNLNQIQINKANLEDFPFHPLLNFKEITKISFLKGLTENKDLIRINKKIGIAKDIKTNRNFNNKQFKIEFKNKNETTTYMVHISGIHILYLILYYYFQIHKSMKQINVYHYSHSAFRKTLDEIKKIENVIKNCNDITNSILIGN